MHADAPSWLLYFPDWQNSHALVPPIALNDPNAHAAHSPLPENPLSHIQSIISSLPAALKEWSGHLTQLVAASKAP